MTSDDFTMDWPTITIWTVHEFTDSEGRRTKRIGICFTEDEANRLKGDSGYRRIETICVYSEGPFKGIKPTALKALTRYPIDQVMRDAALEASLREKLTDEEREYLARRGV